MPSQRARRRFGRTIRTAISPRCSRRRAQRPLLFALYAFNHEIARIAEAVREPMMAEIRLQWWREAVEGARDGSPRAHPVAEALAELFARTDAAGGGAAGADRCAGARWRATETFADLAALEAYADATSGGLMRLAARVLGAGDALDPLARAAGIGFGLTGLLRAVPFHAARRKLYLPLDMVAAEGLSSDEIFAGRESAKLKAVMARVADHAREHLTAARTFAKPGGKALAAVLPAATAFATLKVMAKPGFDPFVTPAELPVWRRQVSLLGASLRGQHLIIRPRPARRPASLRDRPAPARSSPSCDPCP